MEGTYGWKLRKTGNCAGKEEVGMTRLRIGCGNLRSTFLIFEKHPTVFCK